ncbi:hypothetical protein BHF71_09910 [Vulcanibacillus modesticaldus]|uniref:Uncharacterized protein n=1 Tax=Vulcanibacillus modesticaldus TaxID=337097 RepID=A0A1D2YTM4_9BACI|nr:hypothetical protein [Vulcanibacillus modesticaldus]OEF98995.1 hypothetical protein BHF71_09910 [Vulcanibacillus modesticaldus]
MKNNVTIKFRRKGFLSRDELNENNVVVYESTSLISSMSYAGPSSIIEKSKSISDTFKKKLKKINGYFSLGTTDGEYRNVHVYSKKARYLDGINRICYISQNSKDELLVSEYRGSRTSKYSGLYRELEKRLNERGFENAGGKYIITVNNIEEFVEIVNNLIFEHVENQLQLVPVNEIDSLIIEGKKYYYYKAYWVKSMDDMNGGINAEIDKIGDIDNFIKTLANYIVNTQDINELDKLNEKFSDLKKIIENRIENLKQVDLI